MRFTISVSPALSRFNLSVLLHDEMVERLRRIAPRIHDINFTCHIAPFMIDAHGVTVGDSENTVHLRQMVELQERTGIRVTPVFNNIYLPNTRRNLELFVESFKPLYEMGIRSVSIPHILWLKIGLFQRTFPDVGIKNTVLRKVHSGQEFWNCAEAGYEYVNLDQSIARDLRVLKEVARRRLASTNSPGGTSSHRSLPVRGALAPARSVTSTICTLWDTTRPATPAATSKSSATRRPFPVLLQPSQISYLRCTLDSLHFATISRRSARISM